MAVISYPGLAHGTHEAQWGRTLSVGGRGHCLDQYGALADLSAHKTSTA